MVMNIRINCNACFKILLLAGILMTSSKDLFKRNTGKTVREVFASDVMDKIFRMKIPYSTHFMSLISFATP